MKIITNNHPRDIVYGFELSPRERKEFDYYNDEELNDAEFFRYKDNVYDLGEFTKCPLTRDNDFHGWDGYTNDSFFSGILVKYPSYEWGELDTDHIIVGWYCS